MCIWRRKKTVSKQYTQQHMTRFNTNTPRAVRVICSGCRVPQADGERVHTRNTAFDTFWVVDEFT